MSYGEGTMYRQAGRMDDQLSYSFQFLRPLYTLSSRKPQLARRGGEGVGSYVWFPRPQPSSSHLPTITTRQNNRFFHTGGSIPTPSADWRNTAERKYLAEVKLSSLHHKPIFLCKLSLVSKVDSIVLCFGMKVKIIDRDWHTRFFDGLKSLSSPSTC
jgi:hypothetical protein